MPDQPHKMGAAISVQAIVPPEIPPSSAPSPGAAKEESQYAQAEQWAQLTPTAKHLHAMGELLAELRKGKDALELALNELKGRHDSIQSRLSDLEPKYSSSRTSRGWIALISLCATVLMAMGGALLGCPDYIAQHFAGPERAATVSAAVFGGGWSCFGSAVLVLIVATVRGMFGD